MPDLTRREREVLIELCRGKLEGDAFAEASSVGKIARALFITDDAVKQHLLRLYDKFDIADAQGESRRARLAREGIRSGAVSRSDVSNSASHRGLRGT
jgi:DNA-binding CsgD family transcriptional regulator